jgi:hypothetical protein
VQRKAGAVRANLHNKLHSVGNAHTATQCEKSPLNFNESIQSPHSSTTTATEHGRRSQTCLKRDSKCFMRLADSPFGWPLVVLARCAAVHRLMPDHDQPSVR